MSLVGFAAKNHPQQTSRRGAKPEIDDRATAPEVFALLHKRFAFSLDVCAQQHNAKCPRYFTPEQDGLEQSWAGERVWCNPPFSDIRPWVQKAWHDCYLGRLDRPELVVMLVPANRTEQGWWQDLVEPYRDRYPSDHIQFSAEFLKGRMRFIRVGTDSVGANERPPFGCCLLVWLLPLKPKRGKP